MYEPIGTDREGNEIQLFDVIEMNEEDVYRRLERKEDVIRLYQQVESVLSQRERMVLKLRYGLYNEEEYTQREIAAMLGISRSYVSRIEKSAIEKLRNFSLLEKSLKKSLEFYIRYFKNQSLYLTP